MNQKGPQYERPAITGRRQFETHAIGCAKVPGLGDSSYCGAVWSGRSGRGHNRHICHMSPPTVTRSS